MKDEEPMKIAAVCCTFLRPKYLGYVVRCFLEQDLPPERRELVILDDAGQYEPQRGDGWRLISTRQRYPSLGEKRNAAAELVSDDVDSLAVWDDDDIYLPWNLRASLAALEVADWSRPSLVLHEHGGDPLRLRQHLTSAAAGGADRLYHGGWAYRREIFERVGGYLPENNGEDRGLAARLTAAGATECDPIALGFLPSYVYRWGASAGYHLSGEGRRGYQRLGQRPIERARLEADWPCDYHRAEILSGVFPRPF